MKERSSPGMQDLRASQPARTESAPAEADRDHFGRVAPAYRLRAVVGDNLTLTFHDICTPHAHALAKIEVRGAIRIVSCSP